MLIKAIREIIKVRSEHQRHSPNSLDVEIREFKEGATLAEHLVGNARASRFRPFCSLG
ncbi:MAG: hypothetical protein ABI453_15320 [Isosphaeraceae bacterium]